MNVTLEIAVVVLGIGTAKPVNAGSSKPITHSNTWLVVAVKWRGRVVAASGNTLFKSIRMRRNYIVSTRVISTARDLVSLGVSVGICARSGRLWLCRWCRRRYRRYRRRCRASNTICGRRGIGRRIGGLPAAVDTRISIDDGDDRV